MKAAIYRRVSTEDQARDEKTSLESQLRRCREVCQRNGWEIVDDYVDPGRSGERIDQRPEMQRLLDDAEAGRFNIVCVVDLDRLARHERASAEIFYVLDEAEVSVCEDGRVFDPEDESALMTRGVKGVFSSSDKRKVVKRMVQGLRDTAANGAWPSGTPPFGFRLRWPTDEQGKRTGKAVVEHHPEEAETIRLAVRWALGGSSSWEIARRLNELGRPPRGVWRKIKDDEGDVITDADGSPRWHHIGATNWTPNQVLSLLRSRKIIGEVTYGKPCQAGRSPHPGGRKHGTRLRKDGSGKYGDPIVIQLDPIISLEDFEALQKQLDRSAWGPKRSSERIYPLSGIVVSNCGRHLAGFLQTSIKARRYRCIGKKALEPAERCDCTMLDADKLDARVWDKLLHFLSDSDQLKELMADYQQAHTDRDAVTEIEVKLVEVNDQLVTKRRQRSTELERQMDLGTPAEVISDLAKRLTEKIRKLEAMVSELRAQHQKTIIEEFMREEIVETVRQASTLWDAPLEQQRQVYRRLAVEVQILDNSKDPEFILTGQWGQRSLFTGAPGAIMSLSEAPYSQTKTSMSSVDAPWRQRLHRPTRR